MQKINKTTILISLAIIIVILTVFKIVQIKITNSQQITSNSLDKVQTHDQFALRETPKLKYQYVSKLPNLAKNANVYQFNDSAIISPQKITKIRTYFKLNEGKISKDALGKYYETADDLQNLNIYPQLGKLIYETTNKPSNVPIKSERFYRDITKTVINNLIDSNTYKYNITKVEFLKFLSTERIVPTQLTDAYWIRIRMTYTLNGFPMINADLNDSLITFTLNRDGSIHKLEMQFLPENFKKLGNAKLANPKDALQAINLGGGQISQFFNPDDPYNSVDTSIIYSAQLNKIQLIYMLDNKNQQLQPYYQFIGTAISQDQKNVDLQVIISALPDQLFKSQN